VIWIRDAWKTAHLMNVIGLGLGSLKRPVDPLNLLIHLELFKDIKKLKASRMTRRDYETLRDEHKALHKKIFEEQQKRKQRK